MGYAASVGGYETVSPRYPNAYTPALQQRPKPLYQRPNRPLAPRKGVLTSPGLQHPPPRDTPPIAGATGLEENVVPDEGVGKASEIYPVGASSQASSIFFSGAGAITRLILHRLDLLRPCLDQAKKWTILPSYDDILHVSRKYPHQRLAKSRSLQAKKRRGGAQRESP